MAKRFIPALAGNTFFVRMMHTQYAVYPRSRGEHLMRATTLLAMPGLSPLSRGTL